MADTDPPRNLEELLARNKRSRDRIKLHHDAMAEVARKAQASQQDNANTGGG
jgi:hypothetical protein